MLLQYLLIASADLVMNLNMQYSEEKLEICYRMLSTRYTTHVANAYHKPVWVNVGCDQSSLRSFNFHVQGT